MEPTISPKQTLEISTETGSVVFYSGDWLYHGYRPVSKPFRQFKQIDDCLMEHMKDALRCGGEDCAWKVYHRLTKSP